MEFPCLTRKTQPQGIFTCYVSTAQRTLNAKFVQVGAWLKFAQNCHVHIVHIVTGICWDAGFTASYNFSRAFGSMGGSRKCETSSAASLCGAPEVFEVEKGNSSTSEVQKMPEKVIRKYRKMMDPSQNEGVTLGNLGNCWCFWWPRYHSFGLWCATLHAAGVESMSDPAWGIRGWIRDEPEYVSYMMLYWVIHGCNWNSFHHSQRSTSVVLLLWEFGEMNCKTKIAKCLGHSRSMQYHTFQAPLGSSADKCTLDYHSNLDCYCWWSSCNTNSESHRLWYQ